MQLTGGIGKWERVAESKLECGRTAVELRLECTRCATGTPHAAYSAGPIRTNSDSRAPYQAATDALCNPSLSAICPL